MPIEKQLREIEFQGLRLYLCPRGCSEEEMEVGAATNTGCAAVGIPEKYLRCGECGFGDEHGRENTRYNMGDAVGVWNDLCKSVATSQEGAER